MLKKVTQSAEDSKLRKKMSSDYFTNGHMSKVKSGVSINPMVLIRFSSLFRILSRNALLVLKSCSSSSGS